jgi:hypothetical protein
MGHPCNKNQWSRFTTSIIQIFANAPRSPIALRKVNRISLKMYVYTSAMYGPWVENQSILDLCILIKWSMNYDLEGHAYNS